MSVADDVAAVRLILDGSQVAELDSEPWRASCDLGEQLLPHRIDAVALDASGVEIGRDSRWVNLAQSDARIELTLEETETGGAALRVRTAHARNLHPTVTRVSVNGQPLKMKSGLWPLPTTDGTEPLLVHAEAHFPNNLVVTEDAVLGAQQLDLEANLTAVVVESSEDDKVTAGSLAGKLSSGGTKLDIVAVEKAGARVLVVFDDSAKSAWTSMRFQSGRRSNTGGSYTRGGTSSFSQLRMHQNMAVSSFADDVSLQIVSAVPDAPEPSNQSYKVSPPINPPDGDAIAGIPGHRPQFDRQAAHTLADGVAVAGWMAATDNLRRAVVLITGSKAEDSSVYSADAARRYLEAMGVPLEVWTPEKRKVKKSPWGEMTRVSNLRQLDDAVKKLDQRLARQSIVWVRGSHLPNTIELAPTPDIVLAGRK
jgi:hypothetical protein